MGADVGHRADPAAIVQTASTYWAAQPDVVGDVAPSPEVRSLCERARALSDLKRYADAKKMLADATRRNRSPRSPLVYQYVANLAMLTNELFTAITAQT